MRALTYKMSLAGGTRKRFQTLYGLTMTCAQNFRRALSSGHLATPSLKVLFLVSCLMTNVSSLFAQEERGLTREGNKYFDKQKYADAEASYKKALEKKNNFPEAIFNLGDAEYKQERYEDAAKQFELAAKLLTDTAKKARAYHNLGNCHLEKKEWEEAAKAYKDALKYNPADKDTKYNLAYANAMQRKDQQNQQNKQNQKQQNQDKKDDKKDKDKKDKGNQKDQDKKGDKDKKDQDGKGDKQKDKGEQKQKKGSISPEQAEKLLQALKAEEQKTQEKMQKKTAKPVDAKVEKDW